MNEALQQYPALLLDSKKFYDNAKAVVEQCTSAGIQVAGVIKGYNGEVTVSKEFVRAGCAQLATSRMEQIIDCYNAGISAEYMLIRIPMLSEVSRIVKYAHISLNSELTVIEALQKECVLQGKTHGIVLMADLGDLREGFWDKEELIQTAIHVEKNLSNLELLGVGTNLGCYGSIKPTPEKLQELCDIASDIEAAIGHKLKIVSGGATSSYPLVLNGTMPKGISHLRIGEGIILAYDLKDLWGLDMSSLYQDVFTFQAEIIEIKKKPTHPVGEVFIDGFGRKPVYEDRGMRKRALLATGKLDFALNDKILPRISGIEIIGSSSDHTIIDVEDCPNNLKVGDILEFDLTYPSLMYLTNTRYVRFDVI